LDAQTVRLRGGSLSAHPYVLLQARTNFSALVFILISVHVLIPNYKFLPKKDGQVSARAWARWRPPFVQCCDLGLDLAGSRYIDLLAGQVPMEIDVLPTALPHVKAGKLRALATASAKRLPILPDLPTIAESGVPGYESTSWYGFVAPANLPRNVLTQLNSEITRILHAQDVKEKLENAGLIVVATSPEEFTTHIESEMAKATKIIRAANIKAD
jgi:Tripartite tricarboxylate transporter family receptor